MLRFLGVRHLAVIDHLEVEFEPGLNLLTGETGAGKSVLVEAIDLLLGGRASADLVRTGEAHATIQAVFDRPDGREVIVRREISAQGRSRAFIDDALATSSALRDLGGTLVDLHGQHEHQTLLDPAGHVDLLDGFAGLTADVAALGETYDAWRAAAQALERTTLDDREKRARMEMASFQLQEIDKVNPVAGEDEQLGAERTVLANADRLSRLAGEAFGTLYEGEGAALATLGTVWKRVGDLAAIDPAFAPYVAQRDELKSGLEDLAYFLREYLARLDASPERLQAVEDRLAALERLKRRHGPTLADVRAKRQALMDELSALGATDERIAELGKAAEDARRAFEKAARRVSGARVAAAERLARALETALAELAMPKSRVDLRVQPQADPETWTRRGLDAVEFYLSPNPGEEVRPLARIASGGELSRVMLALRTLAAPDEPGRTLVFDEVDAGIGGEAADAVGARLQELARTYQVLCITHLPQIAARAGTHFQISKRIRGGRTETALTRLEPAGRVQEVGRMIAGAEVSAQVVASAEEMIRVRGSGAGETKAKGESERRQKAKAKGQPRGA
ncbi:MAG: DNA repair protein RecN [Vicinamibacterales bacterium]